MGNILILEYSVHYSCKITIIRGENMNLQEYASYDGIGLAELVKSKEVTPQELKELALEGIKKSQSIH